MVLRPGTPGRMAVAQAGHYVETLGPQDVRFCEVPEGAQWTGRRLDQVPNQRGPASAPVTLPAPVGGRLAGLVREAVGFPQTARPQMEPARTAHGQVAAFFDVDNTLVHGTTLFHLAKALCQQGFFRRDDLLRFVAHQARYAALGEPRLDHLLGRALELLAGHDADLLVEAAEQVYRDHVGQRLFAGTTALVDAHLAAGHQVWLVTATPVELAQVLVEHLGATGCLATVAERADGKYTGRLVGEPVHGPVKATMVHDLAQRHGLDLAASYAYGDSGNDLPVLSTVGHPAVVNPDLRLRGAAAARGWPRYDFRTVRRAAVRSADAVVVTAVACRLAWSMVCAVRTRAQVRK
ncbi:MAG: HAD-IB family hydrolase [Micrococcales bacterium]|nr:HAD-IB family hydrolase [Micrococcales bacterium]MCL2666136.1 HAD-IB family hydrolase [Micrococcales bacterium]